ncbi:stalk domain-containing protein [Paenibacillus sp. FSL K6-1096]|uniref:stalk domain-containing protein n=1 Tax=Paenibacillus sp. FSL K6-1096 TaxID=2921460 RepID=UPI0030EFA312
MTMRREAGPGIRRIWMAALWLGIALLLIVSAGKAEASPAAGKTIEVNLDDKTLSFEKAPLLDNGTTLVPFRPLFEAMGLKVGWEPAQQKVTGTKEGLTIVMTIGSKTASVNGKNVQLMQAPKIVDSYTMVPLRFIGESTQALVAWNPYKPQVLVYTDPYLTGKGLTKATAKAEIDKKIAEFKKIYDEQVASNPPQPKPPAPGTVPSAPAGDGSYKPAASDQVNLSQLQGMYYGFSPDYDGYECGGMCWNIITFLPGNKVLVDAPPQGGPETINCSRDGCQTYTIQNGKLKLSGGESYDIAVKSGKLYIDDVELGRVKTVKSGLTLSGTYVHRGFQGLAGISAGSTSWERTLVLNTNGTFTGDNLMLGSVQGGAPTTGGAGGSDSGSYKISGNTIVFAFSDGKVSSSLFFQHDDGSIQIGDENYDKE